MALRIVIAFALVAACVTRADARVRIMSSPGGEVGTYVRFFDEVRRSGEQVVIDGPCFSACTLVLSIVPADRVCATRRAVLGFHAAWSPGRRGRPVTQVRATRVVLDAYPASIRRWIVSHGGLTRRALYLRGRELAALVPRCG